MLRYCRWIVWAFSVILLSPAGAPAQGFQPQTQQRQLEEERASQQRREAEVHNAQLEQMRQVERLSNRDQRQLEDQRQAQAASQQQYVAEQAQQQEAARNAVVQEQARPENRRGVPDVPQATLMQPEKNAPAAAPRWSYANITLPEKFGLALLAALLIALAFPAGILPAAILPGTRR